MPHFVVLRDCVIIIYNIHSLLLLRHSNIVLYWVKQASGVSSSNVIHPGIIQ